MLDQFRSKVTDAGRVVIPSVFRKQFDLGEGTEIVITRSEYGVLITPLQQAIRRAQELVAQHIPPDVDLNADLRELRDRDASRD